MVTIGQRKAKESKTGTYTNARGVTYTASGGRSESGSNSSSSSKAPAPLGSTERTNELLGGDFFDTSTGKQTQAFIPEDSSKHQAIPTDPTVAGISTEQPSPTTAQIAPPNQTPTMPAPPGGSITPSTVDPNGDLAARYRAGFASAQSTGLQAPQSSAQGGAMVRSMLPEGKADTSFVDQQLQEDKGWQEIEQMRKDYFDPQEQKTSLMDTYKKLYKKSGLEELDEEIIDAKTVIEGTEDDIRNEIQAAGGFGTDSQVQAMALSRNKSLLKNYNNLVAMREMKQNHLDTMIGLADKDRQYAEQKSNQMMQFDMQVIEYKNKFVNNTRDQLNKIATTLGFDGLYQMYSQDPRQMSFAEKILGLAPGGMAQAATIAQTEKARQVQKEQLELENQQLQNQKLRNDLAGGGKSGKPISSATALNIADSNAAMTMLGDLSQALQSNSNLLGPVKGRINANNPYNKKAQTLLSMVNSTKQIVGKYLEGGVLRAEDEVKYEKILPKISDTPVVANEKLNNVRRLVESKIMAQQSTLTAAGYNPAAVSDTNIVTAPDGNEYEIIE